MCPRLRREILGKLGVDRNLVGIDLFASHSDRKEKKYMTTENSAWKYSWQKLCQDGQVLWANPPFEVLKKVLTKAVLEPFCMVLVTPNWAQYPCKKMVDELALKKHVIQPGTPLYESSKSTCLLPGRHWETNVSLIDTTQKTIPEDTLDPLLVQEIRAENEGWGPEELKREMEKYPPSPLAGLEGLGEPRKVIVDKIHSEGEALQLIMKVYAKLPSGRGEVLKILVDTGAEANLIKMGRLKGRNLSWQVTHWF